MSEPYMAINGNLYNLHDFAVLDTITSYGLASSCTNCTLQASSAVRALEMGKALGTATGLLRSSSARGGRRAEGGRCGNAAGR
jgi:hypothetical protein